MSKTPNDLTRKLPEQLELIGTLSSIFDDGNHVVALSLAVAIRVLVHDTRQSTSLLEHLCKKQTSLFLSTNYVDHSQPVHLGLVRRINVGVNDGVGGEAKYWPLCDERYFPSPVSNSFRKFDDWWNEVVFENADASLTRRDTVLAVANKDGGAHFDQEVDERYDAFRQTWSGGTTLVGRNSGKKRGFDNAPVQPAVRQIAYEILNSKIE